MDKNKTHNRRRNKIKASIEGNMDILDVHLNIGKKEEVSIGTSSVKISKGARPKTDAPKKFVKPTLNNFSHGTNDSNIFQQRIQERARIYENHWVKFQSYFRTWKIKRQSSILKLQELVEEVHRDQMTYNKGNVFFKELNVCSRELKDVNSSPSIDFLASLGAFLTDAASGITSIAQAVNVDGYTTTFKEIMQNDAEITRPLYIARSQCLEQYRDVEETIRHYHSDTFGSTIEDISDTLKVEDLWLDIKNKEGENSLMQICNSLDQFFRRNANGEVMEKISDSIQGYLNSNPAVGEACKSTVKALHGVYDTWGRDYKQGRSSITGNMSIISNKLLLVDGMRELNQLRSIANNDGDQAQLESDIHDALSSLQSEMREISNIFEQSNETHDNSSWYY